MKTKITLLILFLTFIGYAQNGINYKAVIKNDLGNVVANSTDIVIQFNILEGPTNVFSETHTPESDNNGIIIVNIGEGTLISGNFSTIDWVNGNQTLNVQVSTGSGLEDMGTTQFKVVPYALSSGDKSWETEVDNVHVLSKNVGIGTDTPTELLHINDDDKASINLTVPQLEDESQIEFKNGLETGEHSFFKFSNRSDSFRIELDTYLSSDIGYIQKLRVNNSGLSLENGTSVNEFSTDGTLAGNSNNAVPTEAAVKTYVDNAIRISNTISIPGSSFSPNNNDCSFSNSIGNGGVEITSTNGAVFTSVLNAPLQLPHGAQIDSITVHYIDNSEAQLRIWLAKEFYGNGFSIISEVSTIGNSSTPTEETNVVNHVVNNNNGGYFIRVFCDDWNASGSKKTKGVKITYTY